jgi:energy-coupling factor transporter ATP-binding protein EcfA2
MLPVEKIVEWVKDKPIWWQHSIRLSLQNGDLSQDDLAEVHSIALHEYKIAEDYELWKATSTPLDISGYTAELDEVKLASLSNVVNVGALAEGQKLKLSPSGLTVIYGDNGAGKSSYARILKHACLTRGGQPKILGNAFEVSLESSAAELSIIKSGRVHEKSWGLNAAPDSDLRSIRVFDTDSADHFVSSEDELGYKPSGIHLLEGLAQSIQNVKNVVTEETMGSNGLVTLPEFSDSKVGIFIRNLNHYVVVSELEQYKVTDEDLESIPVLEKDIVELKRSTPEQIKKDLKDKIKTIEPLSAKLDKIILGLSAKVASETRESLNEYNNKAKLADELRDRILSDLPINNVGGASWELMWSAAEEFFVENKPNSSFPPDVGEDCPLCLQEINDLAGQRLIDFKDYLADKTALEAKEAKKTWDDKKKLIKNIDLNLDAYSHTIEKLNEVIGGFSSGLTSLADDFTSRKDLLLESEISDDLQAINIEVVDKLKTNLEKLRQQADEVKDDESLEKIISDKGSTLSLLKDKKLFLANYEHIESNVLRYKALKKYEEISNTCTPKPVTKLTTEICKAEVIQPLVSAFSNELKKFGFNRYKVEAKTRGSLGAQLMKLTIDGCNESHVSNIASEGEQRCIAIACFLAEIEADARKSAVIFDDPVNSLSHQWSARVAKRLVEESLTRQVIVLTHDIVFYKLLHEAVENVDGSEIYEVCLERSRKRAGIVRSTPPWDALTTSKRIKHLKNVMLRKLREIDNDGTETEFRNEAYNFYGYLREAWERLVEEKLLNQVVTRFGRGIQTQRLSRLIDLKEEDFKRIDDGMAKCSTYFRGHDSAPAAGDPYPAIYEIVEDITAIEAFNNELQATRRRN